MDIRQIRYSPKSFARLGLAGTIPPVKCDYCSDAPTRLTIGAHVTLSLLTNSDNC
jgi:hypothetical protein